MATLEKIDLLFQSVIGRFFAIPARKPFQGALTVAQMRVLWLLEMKKTAGLGEVAMGLGITNSSATELVDRLVNRGYASRIQSAKDRRKIILALTPKGTRLLSSFNLRRRERFQRLLGVIDNNDMERMGSALETLNEIIGKWEKKNAKK